MNTTEFQFRNRYALLTSRLAAARDAHRTLAIYFAEVVNNDAEAAGVASAAALAAAGELVEALEAELLALLTANPEHAADIK